MSFENSEVFTKQNLDNYLNELSKEYKKLGGRKVPVEIVLIGGAAVIESYGFRDMTTDVDAIIPAASIMKDAIQRVGSRFNLPDDWINSDFIYTDSYSSHLNECSVYYRTFCQVLYVRIITGEYLIAMKLRAGRKYKNDLSDVVGILAEHEKKGTPISFDMIDSAVKALYGSWNGFPQHSVSFIHDILSKKDYTEIYKTIRENEKRANSILLDFENNHSGTIREEDIESFLNAYEGRSNRQSVLSQLKTIKSQQKKSSNISPRTQQPSQKKKNDEKNSV